MLNKSNNEKPYEIKVSGSRNFKVYVLETNRFLQNYDNFLYEFSTNALEGYKWWWDLPLIEDIPFLEKRWGEKKSRFSTPKNITFYMKETLPKKRRERIVADLDNHLESKINERRSREFSFRMWRNILIYGVTFGCYIFTGITKYDQGLLRAALSTPALIGDASIVLSYPISALESIEESEGRILEAALESKKEFELYKIEV